MKEMTYETLLKTIETKKHIPSWTDDVLDDVGFKEFGSFKSAKKEAEEYGLHHARQYDPTDCLSILKHALFDVRFNVVSKRLEAKHPTLTQGMWVILGKQSNVVPMLSRALKNLSFSIKKEKRRDEDGHFRNYYSIARCRQNVWSEGSDHIVNQLLSLVVEHGNGQIPSVHPLREQLSKIRAWGATIAFNDKRKAECKELANTWLNQLPYIRPVNEDIGKAASLNIIGGLAHRMLEAEKPIDSRPMMQRELVILTSPDHFKIGKTAILTSLLDPTIHDLAVENFELGTKTQMNRDIRGKLLVIADDMNGFTARDGERWKTFQTQTRPSADEKYERTEQFRRMDWIVGTANGMFIPSDSALRARVLACEMSPTADAKDIPARDRGRAIAAWFDEHRLDLFVGAALSIEEDDIDIEAPDSLWSIRRETIENSMSENIEINAAIEEFLIERCDEFNCYFPMIDLCRHLGFLKFQRNDPNEQRNKWRMGETIPRAVEGDDDEFEDETAAAFTEFYAKGGAYKMLVNRLAAIGWKNTRKRVQGIKNPVKAVFPVEENALKPWAE